MSDTATKAKIEPKEPMETPSEEMEIVTGNGFTIIKGKLTRPRKIMLHANPGMGKTTFAGEAPNPILLQTECGADDIGIDRLPLVKSYDEFMAQLRYLFQNHKGYEYVIIDSLNWLEKIIHEKICAEHGAAHLEDTSVKEFGYQAGYSFALEVWDDLILALTSLQEKTGLGLILIAHTHIQKFADPSADSYDRYVPALHINSKGIGAGSRLQQFCDEVFFINDKVFTKESATGAIKALGTGERFIFTERRPSFDAKNRLSMPSEIPFIKGKGWSEYAKYMPVKDGNNGS